MPDEIVQAEKKGFSSPDASWFKRESIEFIKQRLLGSKAKIFNVLDRNMVETLLMEHLSGDQNRRLLIWSLLNIDFWIEDCL
jgi:asparagine synthase (glutamine-hydrolysing)